jgi:hypothetical protein
MRHLFLIHIALDRRVGGRAKCVEQKRDLVLLHEAANLLDRLWRTVAIVEGNEIDLPPRDATLLVHHVPERGFKFADHAVS